jgi:adenine/guanine phosphoribosyltransferase-like PRPP-binding protein
MSHAGWLGQLFDPQNLYVTARLIANKLNSKTWRGKIEGIVVTGVSGMVVGGVVSSMTKLPLVVVRKTTGDCHSTHFVEYSEKALRDMYFANNKSLPESDGKYLFRLVMIDDLIHSGKTLREVKEAVKDAPECEDGIIRVDCVILYTNTTKRMSDERKKIVENEENVKIVYLFKEANYG